MAIFMPGYLRSWCSWRERSEPLWRDILLWPDITPMTPSPLPFRSPKIDLLGKAVISYISWSHRHASMSYTVRSG